VSEFSKDWFSQHIPSWDKIFSALRPTRILEIGSYEGRSAVYCCEFLVKNNLEGMVICVDSWEGGVEHEKDRMFEVEARFRKNLEPYSPYCRARKGLSSIVLRQLYEAYRHASFDLIYIDGSHVAKDVLTDAVLAYPLLRKGGFMIFDDYLWLQSNPLDSPGMAIDAFAQIFSREMGEVRDFPLYQRYFVKVVE
jgi:predicted O-methyltransferase YrrM